MTKSHKIAAFTLNEMVVVLILSSIVVGLAFTSLRLIQKQMLSIQTNYEHALTLNKLDTALWIDFNRYHDIRYDLKTQTLQLANAIDSTHYKISDNYIVSPKDSFNLKIKSHKIFFNGQPTTDLNKIDAIAIETNKDYGAQQIFIFKRNAASKFMD